MNVKLVVASGKSAGKSIAVKGNKLLIGRAEECDVRPLSEEVSRRHCAIHIGPSGVTVEDLKSRNGTFLNGEKISTATKVADGDIIRVGALELKASITMPVSTGSIEDVSEWLSEDENSSENRDTTSSEQQGDRVAPCARQHRGNGECHSADQPSRCVRQPLLFKMVLHGVTPSPASGAFISSSISIIG